MGSQQGSILLKSIMRGFEDSLLLVRFLIRTQTAPTGSNESNVEEKQSSEMGFTQNSSFSQIEVTFWEAATQSSSVNNAIVVLGVLTFALQLCFLLLFMLRCWRFDSRVKEALKHPDSLMKLNKLMHCNLYKQPTCLHCADAAGASFPTSYTTEDEYDCSDPPLAPSIPWDLVQS